MNAKTTPANFPTSDYNTPGANIVSDIQKVFQGTILGNQSGESTYFSNGSIVSDTVKASEGNILSLYATNINAAQRYLWIFNAMSPRGAATAIAVVPIPAGTSTNASSVKLGSDVFGLNGVYMGTGISFGFSSSNTAYTESGVVATDHNILIKYL